MLNISLKEGTSIRTVQLLGLLFRAKEEVVTYIPKSWILLAFYAYSLWVHKNVSQPQFYDIQVATKCTNKLKCLPATLCRLPTSVTLFHAFMMRCISIVGKKDVHMLHLSLVKLFFDEFMIVCNGERQRRKEVLLGATLVPSEDGFT